MMTTIAYDHKNGIIACDSRCARGDMICTDEAEKYQIVDEGVYFFCGKLADNQLFMDYFSGALGKDCKTYPDVSAIFINRNGEAYLRTVTEEGITNNCRIQWNESIGSGTEFALAALDHGKSAKQAVEYAMTRDPFTGGKVRVFDVAKFKFVER